MFEIVCGSDVPETDVDSDNDDVAHPSLNGRVAKIMTRELVYYILLGTIRGSQKYH